MRLSSQAAGAAGGVSVAGTSPAVLMVSVMQPYRFFQEFKEGRTGQLLRDEDSRRPSVPEPLGGDPRPLGHRGELGPDHVGIDRRLADPGAVATVAAGYDIFTADPLGVTPDPLRDQLGMLDEIGFGFEDARN